MHYFIYPSKDATIYSGSVSLGGGNKMQSNTGLDSILEVDKRIQPDYLEDNWSRILIQFDLSSWVTHSNEVYYLNMYDAGSEEIPITNTLYCYPLSSSWEMGVGKKDDYPTTLDGVTWTWRDVSGSNHWNTAGGDFLTSSVASQSFEYSTDDLRMNVTDMVNTWVSGTQTNYGMLIRRNSSEENSDKNYGIFKFFSKDTNTVYAPRLDIMWDDSTWSTGSLTALNTSNDIVLYMKGLNEKYNEKGKARFRVCGREAYPERTFSNTSEYATVKYLPTTSYYSIRDAHTDEVLIPFDDYTKLSCDSTGNYFDLWMDSFQPERFYKIVYKIVDSNTTKYFDDDFSFKVVR